MAYTITGPQKLTLLEKYFKQRSLEGIILDVGGSDYTFEWLKDISKEIKVHTLNNYHGHLGGVPTPVEYDAEKMKLPYKNETVSGVFLLDIIEHLIEPSNIISESHRVLKRGDNSNNYSEFSKFLQ